MHTTSTSACHRRSASKPPGRRPLLLTLLVALTSLALISLSTHDRSLVTFALADPVAHANPEALVIPKNPNSKRSATPVDHGNVAGKVNKAGDGGDDDLNVDTGDDISELGDPIAPVTTDVDHPSRTRPTDPEIITDVVADGDGDAAIFLEAAALFDDPAYDVVEILAQPPPPVPEPQPNAHFARRNAAVRRPANDEVEFTQAVELDQIVPITTDAAVDEPATAPAPAATPAPAPPGPDQVVAGRPTSSSSTVSRSATRPPPASGTGTSSSRATATSRPGSGGNGGESNPDSHSGDQTLEILITDNSAVGTGPNSGTGKGANVDFAVNGFGVSVSGSLKRAGNTQSEQGQRAVRADQKQSAAGKKARDHK